MRRPGGELQFRRPATSAIALSVMQTAATRSNAGRRLIMPNVGAWSRLRNSTHDGDGAARLFDRLDGRLRRASNLESDLRGQLADAQNLHAVAGLRDHA